MKSSQDAPAVGPATDRLARFNELPADAATAELLACCRAPGWARQVAAGRPYGSVAAALLRSDELVAALSTDELAAALAGHPRIGDRAVLSSDTDGSGRDGSPGHDGSASEGTSRREQAGVAGSGESVLRELAEGNAAYERRFGHIYLACATGRSGAELLALLRQRLDNSFKKEWLVVSAELAAINRIRLQGLLAGGS